MATLLRFGNEIINLDNVIRINLHANDGRDHVAVEFNVIGCSDPDPVQAGVAHEMRAVFRRASPSSGVEMGPVCEYYPFVMQFYGDDAKALRKCLTKMARV